MGGTQTIDYEALAKQAGAISSQPPPPSGTIDYESLAKQAGSIGYQPPAASPLEAAAQATGLSPDTRGVLQRKWDEIKAGLAAAQPGGGLKPTGTVTGDAAEFLGMIASEISDLGIGAEAAAGAATVEKAIPSARRAGKVFQELKGTIGQHSVAMTDKLADALAEIKEAVDTGSTLPPVINKFVTRIADLEQGPLTYQEARQFYHNVSDLSASEKLAARPSDHRLIQQFRHALGETIEDTAQAAGRLQQYQSAMKEYARAARISEVGQYARKKIVPKVVTGALLGAGGTGVYEGYRYLKDMLGFAP